MRPVLCRRKKVQSDYRTKHKATVNRTGKGVGNTGFLGIVPFKLFPYVTRNQVHSDHLPYLARQLALQNIAN